jgi:CRP/FNR family cyclic AMP-dependent transcriptional regulator
MSQSCLDCPPRADRVFCGLAPDALQEFDEIKSLESWPAGTVLFREGHAAQSAFVLCEGRVRLTVRSESGHHITLRIASPGEVLGLSAVLAGGRHKGEAYEVTAEALELVQVAEIRRPDLLRFLRQHNDICMQVVNLLSEDLHEAYGRVRTVGLTRTRHSA